MILYLLLVHQGSNGTFAIQLAKDIGCKISASASRNNHDYMKSLGVTKAVDYHDSDWVEQVLEWMPGGVDAAIAIQPNTSMASMKLVKDGGKVISVSGDQFTTQRNIKAVYFPYNMDVKEELMGIIDKIVCGEINITIENVYDFDDGLDALEKVRTRRARGKSIIKIK
ncbi:MAG: zinc-binding dehydrogenase [Tissierella sp.]|uniref:zinc-binding dehydrogenase n=1 Tax=Tissierella sp. TaxID=41274 RepID=UPI003F9675D7